MVMSFWLSSTMRSIAPILIANWEALCKAYGFEEGMRIRFDIRPEDYDDDDNIDIWVDVDMPPVLPKCEFVKLIC